MTNKPLAFGITGSVSPQTPRNRNPSYLLSHVSIQDLLLEVAREPKTPAAVEAALEGTDIRLEDLEKAGLLKREAGRCRINFILFLPEDLKTIKEVTGALAADLAERYLAEEDAFRDMLGWTTNPDNDPQELAFLLIGCFSLDWEGLEITRELGIRMETTATELGDRYIAWAEARDKRDVRGIYWGSHNAYFPDCVLTSFGDHAAQPRNALPDLAWRVSTQVYHMGLPETLAARLNAGISPYWEDFLQDTGRVMLSLAGGSRTLEEVSRIVSLPPERSAQLIALLKELAYVRRGAPGEWHPAVPVLPRSDKPLTQAVLAKSQKILADWLPEHLGALRKDLKGLTPFRYGLPFEKAFSQVWHYLFGLTNQEMVRGGLFADPYSADRTARGFISAVWHPDIFPQGIGL